MTTQQKLLVGFVLVALASNGATAQTSTSTGGTTTSNGGTTTSNGGTTTSNGGTTTSNGGTTTSTGGTVNGGTTSSTGGTNTATGGTTTASGGTVSGGNNTVNNNNTAPANTNSNINYSGSVTVKSTGIAVLPGFAGSFSSDYCGGTAGGAIGLPGFAASAGGPVIDQNCVKLRTTERIMQVRAVGIDPEKQEKLFDVAMEVLASINSDIRAAFESKGLVKPLVVAPVAVQ